MTNAFITLFFHPLHPFSACVFILTPISKSGSQKAPKLSQKPQNRYILKSQHQILRIAQGEPLKVERPSYQHARKLQTSVGSRPDGSERPVIYEA
jgi:hypothetical protein